MKRTTVRKGSGCRRRDGTLAADAAPTDRCAALAGARVGVAPGARTGRADATGRRIADDGRVVAAHSRRGAVARQRIAAGSAGVVHATEDGAFLAAGGACRAALDRALGRRVEATGLAERVPEVRHAAHVL